MSHVLFSGHSPIGTSAPRNRLAPKAITPATSLKDVPFRLLLPFGEHQSERCAPLTLMPACCDSQPQRRFLWIGAFVAPDVTSVLFCCCSTSSFPKGEAAFDSVLFPTTITAESVADTSVIKKDEERQEGFHEISRSYLPTGKSFT